MNRVLPLFLVVLAMLLFVGQAALAADDDVHEGKVVMAGNGKLTMTDKDGKQQHEHKVAADAKITLDGKDCRLEDLKKDMNVKVTTKKGDKTTAIKIEARSA